MERTQIERGIVKLYNDFLPTRHNKKQWEVLFHSKNYNVLYVESGNKIIGSLVCILCKNLSGQGRDYVIIDNVIVHEDYRKMGIGKQLMKQAEVWAKKNNCFKIIVVSNNKFESGGFYKKCGFENKTSKVYIKRI